MSYFYEDITILSDNRKLMTPFNGKSILVTGATGLIGTMIVGALCEYEKKYRTGLKVIAFVRNAEKARKKFGESECLIISEGDVTNTIDLSVPVNYVIHGACITSSNSFVSQPVETIKTVIEGTRNVLEFAKKNGNPKVVLLSSLEVYGTPDIREKINENYVGFIDFSVVRSSYSQGKRMAECLCKAYLSEYDIPITIVRLTQTFGPGVAYEDGRVFAQFARCVIEKKNIVLNTAGRTLRNYCYLRDAITAILTVLVEGKVGEAYNIANKNTAITIADMAKLVSKEPRLGNGEIDVIFKQCHSLAQYGYNPEMQIELDTTKIEALGWNAEVGLVEMFVRMISDMRMEI